MQNTEQRFGGGWGETTVVFICNKQIIKQYLVTIGKMANNLLDMVTQRVKRGLGRHVWRRWKFKL